MRRKKDVENVMKQRACEQSYPAFKSKLSFKTFPSKEVAAGCNLTQLGLI